MSNINQDNNPAKRLIMIPYAEIHDANTGLNIRNNYNRMITYWKNCCVSLISAKYYNPESDVALVTNTDVPENFKTLLQSKNILIYKHEFDTFNFGNNYTWSLAFYKLCALKYAIEMHKYDFFSYMDADVFIQGNFEPIWNECEDNILLYDINHGLKVDDYKRFLSEVKAFTGNQRRITHYGGELFAANYENGAKFIDGCLEVFNAMREKSFITTCGDEFILSVVAEKMKLLIKNGGAYVFRFWTGEFRLVSTCYGYNPVIILHVPDEKECGMIKIFDKYISKGILPSKKKLYKILSFKNMSFKTRLKCLLKKTVFKRRKIK